MKTEIKQIILLMFIYKFYTMLTSAKNYEETKTS